ncbi:DeoR family transcriptional regulator [Shigella flexneri]
MVIESWVKNMKAARQQAIVDLLLNQTSHHGKLSQQLKVSKETIRRDLN